LNGILENMTDNISFFQKHLSTAKENINLLINYLLLLYAFAMPLNIAKAQDITYILVALWIVSFDYKVLLTFIKENRLFQTILLLSFLISISFLWSDLDKKIITNTHLYYANAYDYIFRYSVFFLLPIIIIITKLKKEFIPLFINSFLLGMFVNEVMAYGIFFEFWTTHKGVSSNPIVFHKNHITYSAFVGFTVLLLLYKINHIKSIYFKIIYSFFIITMTINLFMSQGRTGQFSFFITGTLLILIYFRKNIKALLLSFFILTTVFLLAFYNMSTFNSRVNQAIKSVENVIQGKNLGSSFGTRIMAFDTIPYLINKENFLFGVGMGDKPHHISTTLKNEYSNRIMNFDTHGFLHNSHLEMLVSNGLIGIFLYLFIFYLLFKMPIKDPFMKYMAYSLSIYYLCVGMTTDIFFFKAIMSLFAMFLAVIILQHQLEEKTD